MRKFEANKTYEESSNFGTAKIECVKVTAKTATFKTVYGEKRMKINRDTHQDHETVYTNWSTMITA
jgi:hypothetical protein